MTNDTVDKRPAVGISPAHQLVLKGVVAVELSEGDPLTAASRITAQVTAALAKLGYRGPRQEVPADDNFFTYLSTDGDGSLTFDPVDDDEGQPVVITAVDGRACYVAVNDVDQVCSRMQEAAAKARVLYPTS